jgi:DNA polymerase
MRGKWHKYEDAPVNAKVLCTFHPSYLLRNPNAKKDVWADLQVLMGDFALQAE